MHPEASVETSFKIDQTQKKALKKLGISTVRDLIYHFPSRYLDIGDAVSVVNLAAGQKATLYGRIAKLKTSKAFRKKIPMAEGEFTDASGSIKVIWFNQP